MSHYDLPHQSLSELYYQNRDLTINPDQQIIDQLKAVSEFIQPLELLNKYIGQLNQISIELVRKVEPTLRHVLVSHLLQLQLSNTPELACYLTTPAIDPLEQIVPNGHKYDRIAVAGWEDEHTRRNLDYVGKVMDVIAQKSELGTSFFFSGPMFSAKSDALLSVVQHAADSGLIGTCHPLIFAGLNEDYITARRGGRGRSSPVESTYRLKATPVDLAGFIDYVNNAEFSCGDLLVFDEISFIAWGDNELAVLREQIQRLNEQGVSVIFSGLNSDYRAINLPSADIVQLESTTFPCNAFSLLSIEGKFTSVEATHTARIDNMSGLVDLLLPIVVGRNWGIVRYMPVPEPAHLFASLSKHDPEVHQQLLTISGQQELLDWYISRHEE